MTKNQIDQIIEYYANKTLSFGCEVQSNWSHAHKPYKYIGNSQFWSPQFKSFFNPKPRRKDEDRDPYTILGHPVTIGDVLKKEETAVVAETVEDLESIKDSEKRLIDLWRECGIDKSLQDIVKESEFEVVWKTNSLGQCEKCNKKLKKNELCCDIQRLKSPQARELFEFLNQIKNEK